MILLSPKIIQPNYRKINEIDSVIQSIYRLITFSRDHLADDLLDRFLVATHDLQELLSIKNAQMEAQNEAEAEEYLQNLNKALHFLVGEIKEDKSVESEVQLFQLFRLISPEAHSKHPNKYRDSIVQIGSYVCPKPDEVPSLVEELFFQIQNIRHPLVRAIYFHHELIRIHPFVDGNGRTARMAKNWMVMHALYPPIFIKNEYDRKLYLNSIKYSFRDLQETPFKWSRYTSQFFEQEYDRMLENAKAVYQAIKETGERVGN